MAIDQRELTTWAVAETVPEESADLYVDPKVELSRHFGVQVIWCDAQNFDTFYLDEKTVLGGYLCITSIVADGEGLSKRWLRIDDDNRPISEDAITVLGKAAIDNPEGRGVCILFERPS